VDECKPLPDGGEGAAASAAAAAAAAALAAAVLDAAVAAAAAAGYGVGDVNNGGASITGGRVGSSHPPLSLHGLIPTGHTLVRPRDHQTIARFRYFAWVKCPYRAADKASEFGAGKRAPG
jgi:hypothetical protein